MDTLTHRHDDHKLTCPHFVHSYIKTSASLARMTYLSPRRNAALDSVENNHHAVLHIANARKRAKWTPTFSKDLLPFATTQHFRTLLSQQVISSLLHELPLLLCW